MRKYTNTEIRQKADGVLMNTMLEVLRYINVYHRPFSLNTQDDAGEDYLIMLEPDIDLGGNTKTFQFYIQNKGIYDIHKLLIKQSTHENYNKISYQFKIRNIKRCLSNNSPIIVTITDIKTHKVYWHAIQLDDKLKNILEDENTNSKKSIQVYIPIENCLNAETVRIFLKHLEKAKNEQDKRYRKNELYKPSQSLKIIPNSFQNNDAHILDCLYDLMLKFEGLAVLPKNLLVRLFPFSLNEDSRTYHSVYTLHTENEMLFDFFNNLKYNEHNKQYTTNDTKVFEVINYNDKIHEVVRFLYNNLIFHLECDKSNKIAKVCIHKLYKPKRCDCEKCNYERLDIKNAVSKLKETINESDDSNILLRKAFSFYRLSDFKSSFLLYKDLMIKFKKEKKYISQFICAYNLIKLGRIIRHNLFSNESSKYTEFVNSLILEDELISLKDEIPNDIYEILNWLKNSEFYHDIAYQIESDVQKIKANLQSDEYGGTSRNENANSLISKIAALDSFLGSNLIIYEHFIEYEQQVYKCIEALLMSLSIKNKYSSKLKHFNTYTIDMMLFHLGTENIVSLFHRYNIQSIPYQYSIEEAWSSFPEKAINFFNSTDTIIELLNKDKKNHSFRNNTEKICGNIILILSRLEIDDEDIRKIDDTIFNAIDKYAVVGFRLFQPLLHYINRKGKILGIKSLEKWLLWAIEYRDSYHADNVISSIPYNLKKADKTYKINNKNIIAALFNSLKKETSRERKVHNLMNLFSYWYVFNSETKNRLTAITNEYLKERFHSELYNTAVLHNIINYKPYFSEYVKTIPSNSKMTPDFIFSGGEIRNYSLEAFINLAFKLNIDLSKEDYQHLHNDVEYYKWLMNLSTYNYKKFDPYWLLRNQTIYYQRAFKIIPQIKLSLQKYIQRNPLKGLVDVYFKIYS